MRADLLVSERFVGISVGILPILIYTIPNMLTDTRVRHAKPSQRPTKLSDSRGPSFVGTATRQQALADGLQVWGQAKNLVSEGSLPELGRTPENTY